MAKSDPQPPSISMNNTKKEMLAAYEEMLELLKQKRETELKPAQVVEEKQAQEVIEAADSLSTNGIIQTTAALRTEMSRLLGELAERLETEVHRYRQVAQAVQVKEKELQDIYGIEKSALSLAALIEAQHQKRQQTERELAEQKESLTREIEMLRDEWKKEKDTHDVEVKERDAEEQKRRKRDQEEYAYTSQRERQLARETFEDERAKQERELAARQEEMERELASRERAIIEQEQELAALRQRVDAFPGELESAVQKAVKEAVERVEATAKSSETLLTKQFEGERNVLSTRIESLEKTVAEQIEQINRLSQQVEKAYGQVQDIATKAIGAAAESHSLGNLQRYANEPSRRPVQEP